MTTWTERGTRMVLWPWLLSGAQAPRTPAATLELLCRWVGWGYGLYDLPAGLVLCDRCPRHLPSWRDVTSSEAARLAAQLCGPSSLAGVGDLSEPGDSEILPEG